MRHSITTLASTLLIFVILSISSVDAKLARRCMIRPSGAPAVLPAANQVSTSSKAYATKTKSSTTTTSTTSTRRTVTTTVDVTTTTPKSKPTTTTSDAPEPSSDDQQPKGGNNNSHNNNDDNNDNGNDSNVRTYRVQDRFEGDSFFDGFGFDSFPDPTHGNVNYLKSSDAFKRGLAYVDGDGLAVMKVDNTNTIASGGNRDSVRISSKNSYSSGLIVLDVDTMPFGCGVWPAFWTVGDSWPNGGEIDILEGVGNSVHAQYTLHTAPGCQLDTSFTKASTRKHRRRSLVHSMIGNDREARHAARDNANGFSGMAFTGTVLTSNCDATINSNTGCGIRDPNPNSYGSALNENGGGVYATLLDENGVAVWFFPRDSIPDDLSSQSPQPETWGSPKAFWASSQCPTKSFFGPQRIVINTTLCGDWAGSAYSSDPSCPGTCAERVADPKNFDTAQWKIRSVTVYK
ncbi:hypothetical protein FS837_002208 [Tulasnella sp. UAMH 9824]|nr:hypothetical protein FS837_002208 [Tulasnella sp. UAMH 9824]